jgi:hypothetical protein
MLFSYRRALVARGSVYVLVAAPSRVVAGAQARKGSLKVLAQLTSKPKSY